MNGSKSPAPATRSGHSGDKHDSATTTINGHRSPSPTIGEKSKSSPGPSIEGDDAEVLPDAPAKETITKPNGGGDEDAESEAETLINSPVKKLEAEKKKRKKPLAPVIKSEKPQKSRIGSLPVPQDDDDDDASATSPRQSTEVSLGKATSSGDAKEEDVEKMDEDGSDELSSAHSSQSRESSPSSAASENPDAGGRDNSPNPRKRKHRASSVDLPLTKRRSMDPPARRRLRGMHSEDHTGSKAERSQSPKPRTHRRAISTQSALDGTAESSRRRSKAHQFPVLEPKSAKGWEESDASSETTSRGGQHDDYKRPQRGIGRSTSTPGRPGAREHKRHVNKYGFTRLAEACELGDLEMVKEWRQKDPDQLEIPEYAGNKPLQIAAVHGNAEVVAYLIEEGAQTDSANVDKDTPLIDAAENGHIDVVKLLLNAGVDPLRQNLKGQQALDVVTDENEEAASIRAALHSAIDAWNSSSARQRRQEEEESRHAFGPSKELHFMARTYENLLKLVQNNDRNGVQEFLAARVPVDNAIIAAAAKTGDLYLVNMLLAEMSEKKMSQKSERPMLSVLGTSHFEMLKALTELDMFQPLYRTRAGKTWSELAEERAGPMWRQEKELLLRLYERAGGDKAESVRRSSSPVGKQSGGRRKLLLQTQKSRDEDGEDSEEEDEEEGSSRLAPKRQNSRRLFSRKDMRTAHQKRGALSDSDDEDEDAAASSGDDAPGEEEDAEMKPPETPTRRTTRSKSQSLSPTTSPRMLRRQRANSLREREGAALQTVKEEDSASASAEKEKAKARKEREAAAEFALEQARIAEEKRKEEEAAVAEAKRVEEEARRKAEEERILSEERKAEEARKAEELRAEQARKEEEERLAREREAEGERRKYKAKVLEVLPSTLATLLDPESSFKFQGEAEKVWLLEHFSPLRILRDEQEQNWVLNLQAAPLMGKSGLELFFGEECPYYDTSLARQWNTAPLDQSAWVAVERILMQMPLHAPSEEDEDAELAFDEELQKTAERYNAFVRAKDVLVQADCKAKLRRVKLDDVRKSFHTLFAGWEVELDVSGASTSVAREKTWKQLEIQQSQSFVERMRTFWEQASMARTAAAGHRMPCAGVTDVAVVHEK